jgi:hypothetical protein
MRWLAFCSRVGPDSRRAITELNDMQEATLFARRLAQLIENTKTRMPALKSHICMRHMQGVTGDLRIFHSFANNQGV